MRKIGKEVFTKVIHHTFGQINAGITELVSLEFLAPENMYIIGVNFGKTQNASGGQSISVLQKSGTYREIGSYVDGTELNSDDFPLFASRHMADTVTGLPPRATDYQMLPDGSYFYLEKGERIYYHNSTKNGSAGNFFYGIDCIIYYTKTKP